MPRLPDLTARLRLDTRDLDRAKSQVNAFSKGTGSAFGTLDRSLSQVQKSMGRVGDGLADFGKRASVGATLPIAAGFGLATKAASDLAEEQNKANVVFGDSAAAVNDFADGAAKAMGLSERAALEAAGTFGNLFVSLGLGAKQAAGMSTRMVRLGSDLASFNNLEVGEVLARLRSGLLGEQEAMERLGVTISETALKQKAFDLGLVTNTKSVLPATIKTQAAYALILEQTGTAQGDFARTSEGLANQMRILRAEWEDAAASMGQKLIPVALKMVNVAEGLLATFSEMPDAAQNFSLIGLTAIAAVGPITFLAGNVLKLKAGLDAATAAAAGQSLGAGAAAAAGVRLAGALTKVGLVGAGLFAVVKGLQSIAGEAGKATVNMKELVDASDEVLVAKFRELLAFDAGSANKAFGAVLASSTSEAQRLVSALEAAGIATGDWQEQVDRAISTDGKAIVAKEKDSIAAEKAAAALRGATGATDENTSATETNTGAHGANADAQTEAAEAVKEYTEAVENILDATVSAADAEIAQRQATVGLADAIANVAEKERDLADARQDRTSAARDSITEERALNGVEDALRSVVDAERDLARARGGRGDKARNLAEAERGLADAQRDLGAAKGVGKLADATDRLLEAQEKVADARAEGGQAADEADAIESLSRARLDARDAELSLSEQREERAERERQAVANVKAAEDALAAAHINAQTAALEAASAERDLAALQAEAIGKPLDAAAQYRIYRDALIEIKDAAAPGGELRANLQGVIDNLPPPEVPVSVLANTVQANAQLEGLRQQFLGFVNEVGVQGPTMFGPVGVGIDAAATKMATLRAQFLGLVDDVNAQGPSLFGPVGAPRLPALGPTPTLAGASFGSSITPTGVSSVTNVNNTTTVQALGANADVARELDYRTARAAARAR